MKKRKKRRKILKKGILENNESIPEEQTEYNSELSDSENNSEILDDNARILKIEKGGKKILAKNFDIVLLIKIIDVKGKNMIKWIRKNKKS